MKSVMGSQKAIKSKDITSASLKIQESVCVKEFYIKMAFGG